MKIISDYSDKVREVILRVVAKDYNRIQAAEILGYTPRHVSRIKKRYEEYGFDDLFDRRTQTGPRIIKMEVPEKILMLYKIKYKGFNAAHYKDMPKETENIEISYTHLYKTLSEAGLIMKKRKKAGNRNDAFNGYVRPYTVFRLRISSYRHNGRCDRREI
jgi:transposase